MFVGIGFLYIVWVALAVLTIILMAKAMQEKGDDHHH